MKLSFSKIVFFLLLVGLVSPLAAPRSLHRSRRSGVAALRVRPVSCRARIKAPRSVASSHRSTYSSVSASSNEDILAEVSELVVGLSKVQEREDEIKQCFSTVCKGLATGFATIEDLRSSMLAWLRCVAECSETVRQRFCDELSHKNAGDPTFLLKDCLSGFPLYGDLLAAVNDLRTYISRLSFAPEDRVAGLVNEILESGILG